MSKRERVKATASAVPVPQTQDETAEAIAAIGRHQRERQRIEAEMGDALAIVRQAFEERAAPHAAAIRDLSAGVQTWCEANRERITGGRTKTAQFASGDVQWRLTPPKVVLKGIEALLARLKRDGLARFIRVREEVSKEAILAEPEALRGVPGVTIEQAEEFLITPHPAALAEGVA